MNKILVPYDFNQQASLALEQAIHLARQTGSGITLLYVNELPGFVSSLFSERQDNELLEKINDELDTVAAKISIRSGIDTDIRVQRGRVYSTIMDVADEISAGFIVMGTRSKDPSDDDRKQMVGRNASRIIRMARCPVITIGGNVHFEGCRSILLPLDLTRETRQKVSWAISMAKIYGAKIKAVSALWSINDEEIKSKLRSQMDIVQSHIQEAGVTCITKIIETKTNENTAVPALLEYAKNEGDVDLIIIMTQQESSFVDFFVGSHAQEFIRISDIPVMSVVPKEMDIDPIIFL